jgi:hypothetical protein
MYRCACLRARSCLCMWARVSGYLWAEPTALTLVRLVVALAQGFDQIYAHTYTQINLWAFFPYASVFVDVDKEVRISFDL